MTKQEIIQAVDAYVNPEFYDVEGLKAFLTENKIIDASVFTSFKSKDAPKLAHRRRVVLFNVNNDRFAQSIGYSPLPIEEFVRRMPLYFYVPDYNGGGFPVELGKVASAYTMDYQVKQSKKSSAPMYETEVNYDKMYEILLFMLYDCRLTAKDIFTYCEQQTELTGEWGFYVEWYKYLQLAKKYGVIDYKPISLIFSLNELLEKDGQDPDIYPVFYDCESTEPFRMEKNKIILTGEVPVNPKTGEVVRRWLGLWVENEVSITAKGYPGSKEFKDTDRGIDMVEIIVETGPNTRVYCLDAFKDSLSDYFDLTEEEHDEQLEWDPIYLGPGVMEFDPASLKKHRSDVGLTQQELADLISIKVRTYQNWEAGVSVPDGLSLIRIMSILGIKDTYALLKRESIKDPYLKKFRTGCAPSMFLEKK